MYPYSRLRHVTVLLNPVARDNSSKSLFEKNVAPLLHLAGLDVHIVKTEFEGQVGDVRLLIEYSLSLEVVVVVVVVVFCPIRTVNIFILLSLWVSRVRK